MTVVRTHRLEILYKALIRRGSRVSFALFGAAFLLVELANVNHASLMSLTNSDSVHDKCRMSPAAHSAEPVLPVYEPSSVESYAVDNAWTLGYTASNPESLKPTCNLWNDPNVPIHGILSQYRRELANYTEIVDAFEPMQDVRLAITKNDNHDICGSLDIDLPSIFQSQQLSSGSSFGGIEPLLPPLRHPDVCFRGSQSLLNMNYMVHDFAAMCRRLKPTSRTVLVDMGASLEFHGSGDQPAIYLTNLYQKFGIPFDHVYAFEVTPKSPNDVFKALPKNLFSSYHWINVGVEADPESPLNPLRMILDDYNADDFIVIKLDIDTASIENPLAMQLLNDDRFTNLVDHFYFEHHVHLHELAKSWQTTMDGSVLDSLQLFRGLREKGVAAHSWV